MRSPPSTSADTLRLDLPTRREPPGQRAAARAWRWPRPVKPSVWIPQNIFIPPGPSLIHGWLSFAARPWWETIVDWAIDPGRQIITVVAGSQSGKTLTTTGLTGWAADTRAGMVAWYRENGKVIDEYSENVLFPIYRSSPRLASLLHQNGRDAIRKKGGMRFQGGGSLVIDSVGSASAMVGRSPWLVVLDELDKCYKNNAGLGDLVEAATKRVLTYRSLGRVWAMSTPTDEKTGIWPQWEKKSQQWEWIVDCPDCGWRGPMSFFGFAPDGKKVIDNTRVDYTDLRGGIRWERLEDGSHPDPSRMRGSNAAWYECPCCAGRIYEEGRTNFVCSGKLECMTPSMPDYQSGVHIPSLTAPEYRFDRVAAEFLAARHSPALITTFRNEVLALPHIPKGEPVVLTTALEQLRDLTWSQGHQGPTLIGKIPSWVERIYFAADAQKVEFWGILEGVGYEGETIVLWAGRIDSKEDLRALDTMIWEREDGAFLALSSAGIDTGDGNRTQELYGFVAQRNRFLALKGNRRLDRAILRGNVDFKRPDGTVSEQGIALYSWHTTTFQDALQAQIELGMGSGAGALHLPADCPREWYVHIRNERRVEKFIDGMVRRVWAPVHESAPQHLRDAHCMAKVLAFMDGWANVPRPAPMSPEEKAKYLAALSGKERAGN